MRLIVIALLAASLGFAQSHPDFSGTWKMDPGRSESAHQDTPTGPTTLVIRQTPDKISIETTRMENGREGAFHETLVFRLDGAEEVSAGDGGAKVTGKAKWQGSKLITETARNVQASTITTLYTHSLSADGKELTVDKNLTVQHGYQFQGAATTGSGRDIFVKTAN